jgi:hypothetical protein
MAEILRDTISDPKLRAVLSTVASTGARQGAIDGFATSPRRFLSDSPRDRTPIPGLFLTGQDVTSDYVSTRPCRCHTMTRRPHKLTFSD